MRDISCGLPATTESARAHTQLLTPLVEFGLTGMGSIPYLSSEKLKDQRLGMSGPLAPSQYVHSLSRCPAARRCENAFALYLDDTGSAIPIGSQSI